ncbi:hypothetical protein OUZ56_029145 [Daphnia magna]|uniref:Uncharacterized protein n=1 Tax=Daphnia magna TaxID=35525 RepID=A0ABR0B5Y7_9CRUS|nr:hypothetical protein OUZ56_029145 [Daphnia magna]
MANRGRSLVQPWSKNRGLLTVSACPLGQATWSPRDRHRYIPVGLSRPSDWLSQPLYPSILN